MHERLRGGKEAAFLCDLTAPSHAFLRYLADGRCLLIFCWSGASSARSGSLLEADSVHFKHFLEGRKFIVFTDHKPLTHALSSNTDARSPRQTRHLSWISEYTSDIRYIRGERNAVADALSRPSPVISSLQFPQLPSLNLHAMSKVQDPSVLISASSLDLKQVKFNGSVLWCDTSRGRLRPLVPLPFRRAVFEALHDLSHGGARPTVKLIASRYVWP